MLFLAIETSCDETSLALGQVVESQNLGSFWSKINSIEITAALTSSQVSQHEIFGGVVPELGARLHAENIHWLLEKLLNLATSRLGLTVQDLLFINGDGAAGRTSRKSRRSLSSPLRLMQRGGSGGNLSRLGSSPTQRSHSTRLTVGSSSGRSGSPGRPFVVFEEVSNADTGLGRSKARRRIREC